MNINKSNCTKKSYTSSEKYTIDKEANYRDKLIQMANIAGCPKETILSCYDIFLSNSSENDSYNQCINLLQLYREKYPPLLKAFSVMEIF